MHEYMIIGIVVVGTIIVLGGGGWLMNVLRGGRKDTSTKG